MERDIEMTSPDIVGTIRKKVLAADGMAVSWRRDRVWNQVRQSPSIKSRSLLPYATAAGIVLIAGSLYLAQLLEHRQNERRISELEIAIRNGESLETGVPVPINEVECMPVTPVVQPIAQKELVAKSIDIPVTVFNKEAEVILVLPPENSEVATDPAATLVLQTTEPPMIQAIVGRIPDIPVPVAKSRRKKVLLFPFENREQQNVSVNEPILTARIN